MHNTKMAIIMRVDCVYKHDTVIKGFLITFLLDLDGRFTQIYVKLIDYH